MPILRNGNGTYLCCLFFSMSHVEVKKWACHMSLSMSLSSRMSLSLMSPVDFEKSGTDPGNFKRGEGAIIKKIDIRNNFENLPDAPPPPS